MKKTELIKQLTEIEGDPEIFVSKDSEGNNFESLYSVQESYVKTFDKCEIQVYDKNWDHEDAGFDSHEEWEQFKSDPKNCNSAFKMKLYLDDIRPTPNGWIHCRWPENVISYYISYGYWIDEISLDHDLGDDSIGTGYDVLSWFEYHVYNNPHFYVPKISLHTDNSVGRERMQNAIKQINKLKLR